MLTTIRIRTAYVCFSHIRKRTCCRVAPTASPFVCLLPVPSTHLHRHARTPHTHTRARRPCIWHSSSVENIKLFICHPIELLFPFSQISISIRWKSIMFRWSCRPIPIGAHIVWQAYMELHIHIIMRCRETHTHKSIFNKIDPNRFIQRRPTTTTTKSRNQFASDTCVHVCVCTCRASESFWPNQWNFSPPTHALCLPSPSLRAPLSRFVAFPPCLP